MRIASLILMVCFSQLFAVAQTSVYLGFKTHTGFIIPHSPELEPVSNTNPFGFQIDISRLRTNDKAWQTCNCYGKSGLSFAYFNYNNPEQLGNSYNFIYFAEPYLTYRSALKVSLRSAVGITYLNQVYNEQTNPENLFYSAPVSFYLQLGLGINYQLSDKGNLNLGLNYNHISNGGQKQPNKGINFPTFSFGYDYIINHQELEEKPDILKSFNPSLKYYLVVFGSLRSADEQMESSDYLRTGVSLGVTIPLSRISNLTGGLEVGHDGSYRQIIRNTNSGESALVSAFLFGHQFTLGKVHFLTQFGAYLSRPKTIQPKWLFQNYSLWYGVAPRVALGVGLIAYAQVADHMDFRVIYQF